MSTYAPGDLPRYGAVQDPEAQRGMGMLFGADMSSEYAMRFDKRDNFRPGDEKDCGWIGEDVDGVWLCRHPELELCQDPELYAVHADFCVCSNRETSPDLLSTRSAWWVSMWTEMSSAEARLQSAKIKAKQKDAGNTVG